MTDHDKLIEIASREAASVILFNPIATKGDIADASDLIAKRILAAVEEPIRAAALREAADAWLWGGWTDITASVKAGSVIGAGQIMGDWLRDRAAKIEGGSDDEG